MKSFSRRAALLGAGAVAAGTVAALNLWRKPAAPEIHTQVAETGERIPLQPFSVMRATEPAAVPAAARLVDADGAAHDLSAFAGKGLVINMWATWCTPCVAEMPALQVLARKAAAAGILVLPLSSDRGGADVVRKFYASHAITGLPLWLDPKGAAASAWGARGLPTTYIIDRQGRERGRLEGAIDWAADETLRAIAALVG